MGIKYFMHMFYEYVKSRLKSIIMYCVFIFIFALVQFLYVVKIEAVFYAILLTTFTSVVFSAFDFRRFYHKHFLLSGVKNCITASFEKMPKPVDLIEKDYQNIVEILFDEKLKISSKADSKQTEIVDYFTLWAHQIKTPISAMRLLLQTEQNTPNTPNHQNEMREPAPRPMLNHRNEQIKELSVELFKIEQYVEMVLGYLRIENATSDWVLQNHSLSKIIRQAIKNYASVFIRKKITLNFIEMDYTVLSDEKWLVFVMEQLLSNALKYTKSGRISIHMDKENENVLILQDTGIGIEEEDLPRVFEKGFTGYNGRMDKKATGIGLYLCKKVLNKLSHKIAITSKVGVGTTVKMDFSSAKTINE